VLGLLVPLVHARRECTLSQFFKAEAIAARTAASAAWAQ
jgi:hypothetical protein